jgi:glycosyltransferase involved in cell wall biosynthesis
VHVTFARTATPLGRGRIGLLASSIRYRQALSRFLRPRAGSFGVVHAHFGFPDAVVTGRVCRPLGLPYVVTLHGDDAFKLAPRNDIIGALVRRTLDDAAAIICVSGAMRDAVAPLLSTETLIHVIPNGYDDALFHLSDAERDLGILFVGLLVPVKNLDLLLHAYARVRDRVGVPLTLAGDGPLRSSLESLAHQLGVADSVRFLGGCGREDVAKLMQRATALALPSRSEGWPLVLAEALACGTPVVASRVGGIPEMFTDGIGGILVPPNDVHALAEALVTAAERRWDHGEVAASSTTRTWVEQAMEIVSVYRTITG